MEPEFLGTNLEKIAASPDNDSSTFVKATADNKIINKDNGMGSIEDDSGTTVNRHHPKVSQLIEIAKVTYRDLLIGIFIQKESGNDKKSNTNRRFFFEPLVCLDPMSILSKTHPYEKISDDLI